MQPCAVCGGVTVDAVGYCTGCGTYRGLPPTTYGAPPSHPGQPGHPQPAGGAPGYPPAGPPGYPPTSGPPGYPTSGAPGYPAGYPVSGPPGASYPTSGAGHPGGHPAPRDRARSFVVPLIALSVTLVVLVVAIVVVLLVRGGGRDGTPAADPTRTATGGAARSDIDPCVVGTWRVVSHREDLNVGAPVGVVTMTGGAGAVFRLGADGSGEADYGSATTYEGDAKGQTLKVEVSGTVGFRFTARDGTVTVRDAVSKAFVSLYLDGEQFGQRAPFEAGTDPSKYTCAGGSMTQSTIAFTTEFTKVG